LPSVECEVHALVKAHPELLAELGCGTITFAILIAIPPARSDSPPTRTSHGWQASHRSQHDARGTCLGPVTLMM